MMRALRLIAFALFVCICGMLLCSCVPLYDSRTVAAFPIIENGIALPAPDAGMEPLTGIPEEILCPKPPAAEPFAVTAGDNIPRVFMYHLIRDDVYSVYGALFVKEADFERQLAAIQAAGYLYLFADDYQKTAEKTVMLTFDDGYEDNYTTMFPLLKKYNGRATVFLVTSLIGTDGYLTREQIREMADSGYVRFGSHTVSHDFMDKKTEAELNQEFSESSRIISEITEKPVTTLAYPTGKYNDLVTQVAQKYYKFCYTVHSPDSYPSPSDMEISRFYISRSLSDERFHEYLGA